MSPNVPLVLFASLWHKLNTLDKRLLRFHFSNFTSGFPFVFLIIFLFCFFPVPYTFQQSSTTFYWLKKYVRIFKIFPFLLLVIFYFILQLRLMEVTSLPKSNVANFCHTYLTLSRIKHESRLSVNALKLQKVSKNNFTWRKYLSNSQFTKGLKCLNVAAVNILKMKD